MKLGCWKLSPVRPEYSRNSALFFHTMTLVDWSPLTFTPSSDENWFVLFGSLLCFSPQRFFTATLAVFFLGVCPSHKRKCHTARPQTTDEGRYKCYWNWLLIFPMLTACPLRQGAVSSLHTEHGGVPLIVGVLFTHVSSVRVWKLLGSLVTSYFHAFLVQSWLVHCVSVKVTS